MKKQDFKNHVQYYPPHHFIFYPLLLILISICIWFAYKYPHQSLIWPAFAVVLFLIGGLSFMLRQHYALTNQNRIVRLEMRLRYYQLSHEKFETIESQLSFPQIAALRFASNQELLLLIEKTIKENLSPDAIKKSIIDWLPDNMRV
ncbi:hypothetical protein BH10BAC3_BH10BAC3_02920 [soil metagenome]